MFKNYLKTAYRNLLRNKGFTFINIAGLSLGFTACFLIALFIWDEYPYDDFIPDGDRIYRIYDQYTSNEGTENVASTFPMVATTLKQDFPEVEQTARILMQPESKNLFEAGDKKLYVQSGIIVDSTFFDVLPIPFKYGKAEGALNEPASIVLSEDMAERFFGAENPVGKEIQKEEIMIRQST